MKRLSFSIVILLVVILLGSSMVQAQDYSKLIPESPLVLIKIDLKQFADSKMFSALNVGAIKKVTEQISPEFEKLTGFSPSRDIVQAGFVMGKDINLDSKDLNNMFMYVFGNFNPEKIMGELEREKELGVKYEKIGASTIIKIKDIDKCMFAFIDKNLFVIGSSDVVMAMIEGKFKGAGIPPAAKDTFEKSPIFINIENTGKLKEAILEGALTKAPAEAKTIVEKITSLTVYNVSGVNVTARFGIADKAAVAEITKKYEELKKMAIALLDAKDSENNDKIKAMSTLELFKSDAHNKKIVIALAREAMDAIKYEPAENSASLVIAPPEAFKEVISPEIIPVLIGGAAVVAAIAVPNFMKAKQTAIGKSCTANMRTIEGACELYAMDNPAFNVKTLEELKDKGYLKNIPVCRDGGKYEFEFDKATSKINVKCSIHGKLEIN